MSSLAVARLAPSTARPLRILFLVSAHNSLSQRTQVALTELGHGVSVAVAHDRRIADQLTLEWGVFPTLAPVATNVDEMIDAALTTARDAAGVPTGATVVLTAGRRTGTPGATNLIMVREIP